MKLVRTFTFLDCKISQGRKVMLSKKEETKPAPMAHYHLQLQVGASTTGVLTKPIKLGKCINIKVLDDASESCTGIVTNIAKRYSTYTITTQEAVYKVVDAQSLLSRLRQMVQRKKQ